MRFMGVRGADQREAPRLSGCGVGGVVVAVELPRDRVPEEDEVRVGAELRALWAVEQVRTGRCGVGKGAELADMPRAAFMLLLGAHGVPVIDYDAADLREELRALEQS